MTVHPIFIGHYEEQKLFEICLTKRLAEKQVNYLNEVMPNKGFYTYPIQIVTSKKQGFNLLSK